MPLPRRSTPTGRRGRSTVRRPYWLVGVCLAILPLAIGAAVLRYRLAVVEQTLQPTQVALRLRPSVGAS